MRKTTWEMYLDERGMVASVELVLIVTLGTLATLVGFSEAAVALNSELNDISGAVGALDQSYFVTGFESTSSEGAGFTKSAYHFSAFIDLSDDCDAAQIALVGADALPNTSGG